MVVELGMDSVDKIKELTDKTERYKAELKEKMKYFHGVRHENSLSELKYTQIMVLRDMIRGLEKELLELKQKTN